MRAKNIKNIVQSPKQAKKLRRLKVHLRKILATHLNQYVHVKTIYKIINSIRTFFKEDTLSKKAPIEKFREIRVNLKEELDK